MKKRFYANEYYIWAEFGGDFGGFLTGKYDELQKSKIKAGITPPHMTFTFVRTDDEAALAAYTKSFFACRPVCININSADLFQNGVVFYKPELTAELARLHRDFCSGLADFGKLSWEWYAPGSWTAHIALTAPLRKHTATRALSVLENDFSPFCGVSAEKIKVKNCKTGKTVLQLTL